MVYSSARGPRQRFPTAPRSGLIRCYNCNRLGHTANVCQAPRKVCFVCGKSGHISTTCRDREGVANEDHREKGSKQDNGKYERREKSNW